MSSCVGSAANFRINLSSLKENKKISDLYFKHVHNSKYSEKDSLELGQGIDGGFQVKNLNFSYDNKPLLTNINFDLKLGDVMVIKGESGSGKSTLLSLCLGLLKPTSGEVLIDGKEISKIRNNLFKDVGYVGPEPYLIPATVRENLLYVHPNKGTVSDKDINSSLKFCEAEKIVSSLNQGLDTVLNESAQLSTGQKQRLAITRALIRKPKLLILDEFSANLDYETEKDIQESIDKLKNKTFIVSAHRLQTLKNMDKIIFLDKGKIVEQGTYYELLRKRGEFYKLWRKQGAWKRE